MRMAVVHDPDDVRGVIRAALKARGMTQTQLAADVGLSLKHVNQMLQGQAGISLPMLFRILERLDTVLTFIPIKP
jgi:transcriptional regulator with XRE-family HTH domain